MTCHSPKSGHRDMRLVDASATLQDAGMRRTSPPITLDGAELRRQLAVRGIGQSQLAQVAGVAPSVVSGALHGRPLAPRTVGRLARALAAIEPIRLDRLEALLGHKVAPEVPASEAHEGDAWTAPTSETRAPR